MKTLVCRSLFIFIWLFIAGCQQELYGSLDEQEANEMIAVLLDHGLDAKKAPAKKGKIKLLVEESQINLAINALKRNGYPRHSVKSVGELFEKSGMISSPLEEKARYVFAISQDIAYTITKLDGVVESRAHIVLAEEDKLGRPVLPASASVLIKHLPNKNIKKEIPKIKALVQHGIPGIDLENISIALFEAEEANQRLISSIKNGNYSESGESGESGAGKYTVWFIFIAVVVFLNLVLYMLWKQSKDKKQRRKAIYGQD